MTSPTALRGMARIAAQQYELASNVTIAPEVLADWYARQVATQRAYLARLEAAMKAAHADPKLEDRESPVWRTYFRLDARYRYAFETLGLLAKREHCVVCPVEGIPGVSEGEWAAAVGTTPTPDEFAAWRVGLSLRGLLTGEDRFAWERYGESAAPEIDLMADELYARWKS